MGNDFYLWNSQGTDMSSLAASDERTVATPAKVIQPAWVRAMHWTNAVAMILMIMSGYALTFQESQLSISRIPIILCIALNCRT